MSRRAGKYRIYMNVGYDLTEQQLRDFFNQYGNVTDVYLPKHKSGRNKGFGFTTFGSEEGLTAALAAQEYVIGGDIVKINRAGPRPEHEASFDEDQASQSEPVPRQPQLFGKGPRLYVGGVAEEITEERLKTHFSRWGNVVDLYFPGKKGQSRVNYCFVTFDNWRSAQRACNQSERSIDGMPLQSINLAQERTAEQEQQANVDAATAAHFQSSPAFNVGPLAAGQKSSTAQQLMQAQLQAHQLRGQQLAGLGPQPHLSGRVPGMLPNPEVVAAMAAHPEAYQQLLNSMMVQRGRSPANSNSLPLPAPGAGHSHGHTPHGYNAQGLPMDSGLVGQYPQGLGSMPMDLQRLYASSAPAAMNRSLHAQDPYGLSQPSADHTSLAGVPLSHQLPAAPPGGLGPDPLNPIDPQTWAWGAAPARLDLPNTDLFSLNSQMEYMMSPQDVGAASLPAGSSGHGPYGGEHRPEFGGVWPPQEHHPWPPS